MKIEFKIKVLSILLICLLVAIATSNGFVVQTSKIAKVSSPMLTFNDFLINGDPNYTDDIDDGAAAAVAPAGNDYEADDYFDERIVGGTPVSIRQFPFQASVQYNEQHICGGAIVGENLVITAAHCFQLDSENSNLYRVRVGSSQHKHGGQLVRVSRIIPHELYSPLTLDNDVAIIVLATRLTFNQNVKPVIVAKQNDAVPAKSRLFISGWGVTSEMSSAVATVLRSATVRLLNEEQCIQSYRAFTRITPRMFCAGAGSSRDSCQGDSGGPLVAYHGGSKKPKLFGVVSWGIGCAQEDYPGVYAKISALRPWINERVLELRKSEDVLKGSE